MSNWVVLKFGGSSVADPKHWQTITEQVNKQIAQGNRPLLVLSALKNISNLLEGLLHQALAGVYPTAIKHLEEQHLGFCAQLGLSLKETLNPIFSHLNQQCQIIQSEKSISPARHAEVLACGELLSTTIGSAYLQKQGLNAQWIDARTLLSANDHTDPWHHFTSAECDYRGNSQNIKHRLSNQEVDVFVTQGFIASDANGATVLLGREGSDTSAAYLGAAVNAQEIQIWTDVPGVFTSNPREIDNTRQIPELSYQQANLMAKLGAKVLHPRAVNPAQTENIPILVKSTQAPEKKGTQIGNARADSQIIGIAYEPQLLAIELSSSDSSFFSSLQLALEKMGYDLLDLHLEPLEGLQVSYWVYKNSDSAEPNTQRQINRVLPDVSQRLTFKPDVAMISLIMNEQESSETTGLSGSISEVLEACDLQRIHVNNQGYTAICVNASDCLTVTQKLHDEFCQ